MLLFDAHLDLAWNAIDWKRDLELTIQETRDREVGMTDLPGRGCCTVSFPELRRAGIGVCIATVLARLHRPGNPMFGYATPECVYAVGQGQLAYYRAMERKGVIRLLTTAVALDSHVQEWQAAPDTTPIGVILSMEGADPIIDPENVREWHAAGLRALGLTHYGKNRYGGGTECQDGLEPQAQRLLSLMQELGIVLDVTHLSDLAFEQAKDWYDGPILASHQNARKFVPAQRQFSDEQLKWVIERGGVVGAALDAWMLQPGWIRGKSQREVTLERVVDNIEHVCQLAGNSEHAGIGSDLDGGFGTEQCPADLDTIADLRRLEDLLQGRGFSDSDIRNIFHQNWLRFWRQSLPD